MAVFLRQAIESMACLKMILWGSDNTKFEKPTSESDLYLLFSCCVNTYLPRTFTYHMCLEVYSPSLVRKMTIDMLSIIGIQSSHIVKCQMNDVKHHLNT